MSHHIFFSTIKIKTSTIIYYNNNIMSFPPPALSFPLPVLSTPDYRKSVPKRFPTHSQKAQKAQKADITDAFSLIPQVLSIPFHLTIATSTAGLLTYMSQICVFLLCCCVFQIKMFNCVERRSICFIKLYVHMSRICVGLVF